MSMISELVKGLRKLGNQWKHNDVAGFNLIFDAADTIETLSEKVRASNLHNGWIPVSERLPDADDCPMDCMVTRKSKYIGNYVDIAVAEKNGTWTHEDWNAIVIDGKAKCISTRDADIIAWMPLPEPYREDVKHDDDRDTAEA